MSYVCLQEMLNCTAPSDMDLSRCIQALDYKAYTLFKIEDLAGAVETSKQLLTLQPSNGMQLKGNSKVGTCMNDKAITDAYYHRYFLLDTKDAFLITLSIIIFNLSRGAMLQAPLG